MATTIHGYYQELAMTYLQERNMPISIGNPKFETFLEAMTVYLMVKQERVRASFSETPSLMKWAIPKYTHHIYEKAIKEDTVEAFWQNYTIELNYFSACMLLGRTPYT